MSSKVHEIPETRVFTDTAGFLLSVAVQPDGVKASRFVGFLLDFPARGNRGRQGNIQRMTNDSHKTKPGTGRVL
ncbi:MAG: hypothetical protein Q4G39_00625 [Brachymonas sp.]|nr:hypothetical protein [Brachymonas sp.]